MNILVGIHVSGDYNPGIKAAQITLDDPLISEIFKLSKRAKRGQIISAYDSTPVLGTSDIDLENNPVKDIADLSAMMGDTEIFCGSKEGRSELVMLFVDGEDFWWEGVFKHTNTHWETRMIPLSFLPQPVVKVESGSLPDLNMTPEQMNAIHEKIARGISHGLNAREIEATFQRHVTKAQLIRCMMELIERSH